MSELTGLREKISEVLKAKSVPNFDFLPQEEVKVFITALKNFPKLLPYFEIKAKKEDLEKWALIYISLHNLFHEIFENHKIEEKELASTLKIFLETENLLSQNQKELLTSSYALLAIESLNLHHELPYLISEKIILGESYFFGVFEPSLWGTKIESEKLLEVVKNVNKKFEEGDIQKLIEAYKNFKFDILKFKF
jgi:hypothetical protein